MTDKKFFWGIGIWLVLLLAGFMAAARWLDPMDYMDNEYASWQQQKNFLLENGENVPVIFLGDSICQSGVMPEILGDDIRVLALGGSTAIEMHYALEEYLRHHPQPQRVFIAFCPMHYANMESYRSRDMYFHYMPWHQVLASQLEIFRRDELPWFQYVPDLAEDLEYMLRLPTKYFRTIWDSRLARGEANRQQYEAITQARGHRYFGLSDNWYEPYRPYEGWLKPFKPLASIEYYLYDMIDICKARGIEVQILQAPMHALDYELLRSSGYLADYLDFMARIAREKDIPVETEMPVYDVSFFGDNLHVNEAGARRYSQSLKERYGL